MAGYSSRDRMLAGVVANVLDPPSPMNAIQCTREVNVRLKLRLCYHGVVGGARDYVPAESKINPIPSLAVAIQILRCENLQARLGRNAREQKKYLAGK